MRASERRRRHQRRGFTTVEVSLVSGLMVLLAMILGATWSAFGRTLIDADTRCRLVLEARMAATALAHDLGGYLPASTAGGRADGRLVGRIANGSQLRLCFDGGPPNELPNGLPDWGSPDTVITYSITTDGQAPELVRLDESTGAKFTVARYVKEMIISELGSGVQIQLTLSYRNLTQTYTLSTIDPWQIQ
jgi:hypothetical protein